MHTRGKMTGTIPQSNHPTGKILLAFVRCGSETMIEQGLEASADQANLPNCSGLSGSTWERAGHGWLFKGGMPRFGRLGGSPGLAPLQGRTSLRTMH